MFRSSGYFFIGCFALAVVAFWKTYVTRLPGDFPIYAHLHATLMVLWFGLLIAQPFLIRAGKRSLHRALGKVSYVLVPLIAITALALVHDRLRHASGPALLVLTHFSYLTFGMLALFVFAYAMAIKHRRDQALHARYMICTMLAAVDPILGRIMGIYVVQFSNELLYQLVSYIVIVAVLALLIVRERNDKRGRSAFPVMLGATTFVYGLFFTLAQTETWRDLMLAFRAVPFT